MGDRANVYVTDGDEDGVYLYTHSGGYDLPCDVKVALTKCWRWGDNQYLARIIFDEMMNGCHDGATGFGISSQLYDNEHLIVRVDCGRQEVAFLTAEAEQPLHTWSFKEFIRLTDQAILKAYQSDHH